MSHDVLIIGSGPAGVHAAYPLVKAGKRVCMVDGGYEAPPMLYDPPRGTYDDVRRQEPDQYRWFLGEDLSNIPLGGLAGGHGGGMAHGNRAYVTAGTEEFLPLKLSSAQIIQSLAQGGLGAVWGAACAFILDHELTAMGLNSSEMQKHYRTVSERIGVSGPQIHPEIDPPLQPDHHAEHFLKAYRRKEKCFRKEHLSIVQPHSAVLTRDKGSRKAHSYSDMDYFADAGRSVYRPQYTLQELQAFPNFQYADKELVERIIEKDDGVEVHSTSIKNGTRGTKNAFKGNRVILAAGAIGTARILLRSFNLFDTPLPLIAKPHAFIAALHGRSLGASGPAERCSLCQLLLLDEERHASGLESACAQIYSYKSLQLFRLLGSIPLPIPEAMSLLALLAPSLNVIDIRFPGLSDAGKTLTLRKDAGGDRVHIHLGVSEEEQRSRHTALKRIKRGLRMLGAMPLRTMMLPEGSSSHYGGTVPFQSQPGKFPFSVNAEGKLHQGRQIYVADASVFLALSAKPFTLTIMANANRIGEHVLMSLAAASPHTEGEGAGKVQRQPVQQ